jgi:hypothetical protein
VVSPSLRLLSARELLNATTDHGGVLEVAIIRASFAAHVEQITPLRSALLNVLAAKALMHHLLLDHSESRQKALSTVRLIHLLIGRLREDAIEFLDHVIGVSRGIDWRSSANDHVYLGYFVAGIAHCSLGAEDWQREPHKGPCRRCLVETDSIRDCSCPSSFRDQAGEQTIHIISLHLLNVYQPFAIRAREMVCTLDDDDSERFLREVANAL